MPALSETEQIEIATSRTLAGALDRGQLVGALRLAECIAVDLDDPDLSLTALFGAALGAAQARLRYLAEITERLAGELDRRGADPAECGCWNYQHLNTCIHAPRPTAAQAWAEAGQHFSPADFANSRGAGDR
jgi:hypothetical protein